jgi:hypothetical protein
MNARSYAIAGLTGIGLILLVNPVIADETGFASSHDLAKQGGRLCMTDHAHAGSGAGSTKSAARAAAIRSWADFTNMEYGSSWASYSASGGQKVGYTKESSGWSATVEGRPCKR